MLVDDDLDENDQDALLARSQSPIRVETTMINRSMSMSQQNLNDDKINNGHHQPEASMTEASSMVMGNPAYKLTGK